MLSEASRATPFWQRFDIRRIEDLSNLVLGAELDAVQMSPAPLHGSLAFAAHDGVIFSSGLIKSKVMVNGIPSPDALTLVIGLKFGLGSRLWLNIANEGDVGVVLPGDELDGLYTCGSLYVAATLPAGRLDEEAFREGVGIDPRTILQTGLHERPPIESQSLLLLRAHVADVHARAVGEDHWPGQVGRLMLRAVVDHCSRLPARGARSTRSVGAVRVVCRAREYIGENLASPIRFDDIARAAQTSRRTLFRAFVDILEETPGNHVRRLRLHRIRQELLSSAADRTAIAAISARWGIREATRMSGFYRDLFGEPPSRTRAANLARLKETAWL